jgi:hypothetical protein
MLRSAEDPLREGEAGGSKGVQSRRMCQPESIGGPGRLAYSAGAIPPHFGQVATPDAAAKEARDALDLSQPDYFFQGCVHGRGIRFRGQDSRGFEKQLLI